MKSFKSVIYNYLRRVNLHNELSILGQVILRMCDELTGKTIVPVS